MPLHPDDLPGLAQLFAPMAAPEILGVLLPVGTPLTPGMRGNVELTRAWLAALDDAIAKQLLDSFKGLPLVAAALTRANAPASLDGPWPWVLEIYPTVDREEFWRQLKDLIDPKRKRILVVWGGGRQVGKSYTGEYILFELQRRAKSGSVRAVYQRVDGAGSVENVMRGVLSKLGLSDEGAPSLEVQRSSEVAAKKEWWLKETAAWFVEQLHANPTQQVWLALDGHAKNAAHPELNMFCAAVVAQVARRFYDPNGCRLLLIDFPEGIAGAAPAHVTGREEVKLPTEAHLTTFLEHMLGASPETRAKASQIWLDVNQQAEMDRLPTLADKLIQLKQAAQ